MQLLLTPLIFYVFSAALVLSSIMVTLSQRSVHAVLWLIMAFVATAGLWILIQAEFLGLILIVVYVGAVMTLFLFVVMMLNLNEETTRRFSMKTFFSFAAIFMVMAAMIFLLFVMPDRVNATTANVTSEHTLSQLGLALFQQDALSVELVAVILLIAIVGAIYLTHREHTHRKKQVIARQHAVTKKDRLKIVSGV